MNIGIVTTWFERGASYVSKQYQELLEQCGHEIYIFSRGGIFDPHFGNAKHVFHTEQLPAPYPDKFNQEIFINWLKDNKINAVLFNEQKEMSPLATCTNLGVKTGAYIDYYTKQTVQLFAAYDFLICNTKRHYSVFQWHPQAYYLPWGTDTNLFTPQKTDFSSLVTQGKVTFFHSCGFSYYRKGTDLLIDAMTRSNNRNMHLVLHAQKKIMEQLPEDKANQLKQLIQEGQCTLICETVSAPGLYHLGDVYVYPSRLDGLGLTMAEALSCGLPIIVPNEAPMNEFGNDECRYLVPVAKYFPRSSDNYFWPMNEIKVDELSSIMQNLADKPEKVKNLKKQARSYACNFLDWKERQEQLNNIFCNSCILQTKEKSNIISKIQHGENVWKQKGFAFKLYDLSPCLYKFAYKIMKYLKSHKIK